MNKYTIKLYELLDGGLLDYKAIVEEMICYLGDDELKEFMLTGFGGTLLTEKEIKELEK